MVRAAWSAWDVGCLASMCPSGTTNIALQDIDLTLWVSHITHVNHTGEGVEMEEGSNRLVCPSCRADQCVACGVEWHKGVTCDAYQKV